MTQNLFLGDKENRLLLTLEANKIKIFTFSDAQKILRTSNSSVKVILFNLVRKNRIQRIEKGKYLLVPARAGYEREWSEEHEVIVPHLVNEYYIGFWTAMNYWEMTEQIPYTVFVVITKRKRNLKFEYQNYQFVTLSKKKFFGFIKETRGNIEFNISTKEKTIIDGLMYPEYCGKISEMAKAIWNSKNEINWKIVYAMAKRIESSIILRRLGYLVTILRIDENMKDIMDLIRKEQFKGFHFLDPTGPKKVLEYSKEYGLKINRTKNELLGWMEY